MTHVIQVRYCAPVANGALSQWLRSARLSQRHPETGKPWSQAYLAQRVTEETGWTLYREAYVYWENGTRGMQPETLQRFVDFWAKYGVEAPDLTDPEPAPALSLEERAVLAAERQAAAAEAQTILMAQLVAHLTGSSPVDPAAGDRAAAFLAQLASRQPLPASPATLQG